MILNEFSKEYLRLLTTTFAGLNLTKILDPEEFYHKQILDSVHPYQQSAIFQESIKKTKTVVDVGFGGGFPILPLAKLLPDVKFVGIEARQKKVTAVASIATELGLKNVNVLHSRLEDFYFDQPAVVTFKAVGKVIDYLPIIQTNSALTAFFYKGPQFEELEGKDLKHLTGWKFIKDEIIQVPSTDKRHLISFSSLHVPRRTPNYLVKLSDLF